MNSQRLGAIDDLMLQRVYGEFLEMPGLRLTCQQAQRLWGLDEQTCHQILELLVDARFLYQPRQGMYMRTVDHHSAWPRPTMAKAGLDVDRQTVKKAG